MRNGSAGPTAAVTTTDPAKEALLALLLTEEGFLVFDAPFPTRPRRHIIDHNIVTLLIVVVVMVGFLLLGQGYLLYLSMQALAKKRKPELPKTSRISP
jgi:hypothetical protein